MTTNRKLRGKVSYNSEGFSDRYLVDVILTEENGELLKVKWDDNPGSKEEPYTVVLFRLDGKVFTGSCNDVNDVVSYHYRLSCTRNENNIVFEGEYTDIRTNVKGAYSLVIEF